VLAASGRASLDVLKMHVAVVALQRRVSGWMTIHAAGMHQHRVRGGERIARGGVVLRGMGSGREQQSGEKRDPLHDNLLYAFRSSARMGRRLMRFPVAAKIALQTAGATGGTPASATI